MKKLTFSEMENTSASSNCSDAMIGIGLGFFAMFAAGIPTMGIGAILGVGSYFYSIGNAMVKCS